MRVVDAEKIAQHIVVAQLRTHRFEIRVWILAATDAQSIGAQLLDSLRARQPGHDEVAVVVVELYILVSDVHAHGFCNLP